MFVDKVKSTINNNKILEVELFLFKDTSIIAKDDYDNFVLFEEKEDIFWIEHNMIGNIATKIKPILISRTEMPYKNDLILMEQLDGNFTLEIAKKDLNNKDLYIESKRISFKVISELKDITNEFLNKIKTKEVVQGKRFYIECENKLYKRNNEKEMDYIFYDSKESVYKVKEPIVFFEN